MIADAARREGLVAGFLCGAALGAPLQNLRGGHILQLAGGRVEGYLDNTVLLPDKPDRATLRGLHAIAGQQFLAQLAGRGGEAIGQHPVARGAALLAELSHGADATAEGPVVGALRHPGRPLRRALARWNADYPWDIEQYASPQENSRGAGAAPAALACALTGQDPVLAARLTHVHEDAVAGAAVLARAAVLLAQGDNPKRLPLDDLIPALLAEARAIEDRLREGEAGERWRELGWGFPAQRFSACLESLASLLRTGSDDLAEKTILATAREHAPEHAVTHVQHGFAPAMVPWVLYRALGPLSPAVAVEDALNRGGETALAAALIGALLGARHGIETIPPEWQDGCLGLRTALALARADASDAATDAWLADERRATTREEEFRAPLREALAKRLAAEPPKPKSKPKPDTSAWQQGVVPFAPPPQVWLQERSEELSPWDKKRLKAERGRKRIDWKETRRAKEKEGGEDKGGEKLE